MTFLVHDRCNSSVWTDTECHRTLGYGKFDEYIYYYYYIV